ncbi:MAG: terminase, partial [Rhodospirillales bacterium]|nr:terminase [Rhodospirillales bacterium]
MADVSDSSPASVLDPLGIEVGSYAHDPLGFVLFAFPWGEAGTVLASDAGPEPWQREVLSAIGRSLSRVSDAIRIAVASGHGVGKSALVAWIIVWALATFRDTRGIVTANTATQLKTKTWPELTKWLRLAACAD